MISLFIDTSLASVSISIIKDNKILSLIQKDIPNMHSVYATSFIKKALDDANIDSYLIDNIMVVTGPGSFTGLRIGVTIAKTYGYLLKKYITPVSSLKALALSSNYKGIIMSVIPANKTHYYVSIYDEDMNTIKDEEFISGDTLLSLVNQYNPYIVSSNMSIIGKNKVHKVIIDVKKVVEYYLNEKKVHYHKIVPNYRKLPQALEDNK